MIFSDMSRYTHTRNVFSSLLMLHVSSDTTCNCHQRVSADVCRAWNVVASLNSCVLSILLLLSPEWSRRWEHWKILNYISTSFLCSFTSIIFLSEMLLDVEFARAQRSFWLVQRWSRNVGKRITLCMQSLLWMRENLPLFISLFSSVLLE